MKLLDNTKQLQNYNKNNCGGVPESLASIHDLLVKEQIYLKFKEIQEKTASRNFSDRALAALNISFREAQKLFENNYSITQQAKMIEKIQIAAVESERFAAFTKSDRQAYYYSHLAQKIADIARSCFHKNKEAADAA